ncbi:MAG: ABC transporter substrate-binding protein [Actinomycetales bacterium]|jgi:peptide/nickel transport system substrate-binding protein|uniref:ABC transporter substrate-binding protein n=1 Tax=Candidatus Phosphoribacter hodrii TaxID=2953743 RepID=A0A935IPC2_9MICO|nr:ABC transporter substrate-binding protein [Candidatus Phosphoribacter hodrii]MBP8837439.1 ABC transporter substrate-binding protein [Dermatophilaceae bacterium]OPZ54902.1 MAG: Glutathione-binding protein GsiB precursor [bacterium ADurb.BinA028]MBL0004915.1 ABC transporter substrate-binding protein [Candidatus Phosphoribacter hodrii]HOA03462.1 ABC transporter substrate-binding protein [Dermatophilaceae bacterium]
MQVLDQQSSRRGFLQLAGAMGAAAAFAGTVSACAPGSSTTTGASGAAGGAKADGTITAAISYELGTNGYDPMTTSSALTIAANWHVMEGLTEVDPASREVYAALAKELPKATGTSVDIALRDGAVFHNGSAVTADDVVFSIERVLDPANKSLYRQFIPFIKGVAKKDEKTVTLTLAYPSALLAARLAVVKIVPKAVVTADAKAFDAKPIGTGPWKLTDNGATSKQVTFERNDAYTGSKKARAKAMKWQIIPDASTRTNAVQSKSVQAIDSVPYLSIDQLKTTSQVDSVQGFGLLFAMFNNSAGNPFATKENRQAFFYAIDMAKVVQTAMLGQASPATSFVQEGHPQYVKAKTVYSHDAAKATAMFKATGLTKLRLLCTDHDWVKKCTPLIQESLKAAGLEVEFTEKKSADVYNTIDGKPEAFDVVIAPGDPSVFGNDLDLLMRWWYAGDVWTDTRMHWKGSAAYTQVQSLLDAGLQASDEAKAKESWASLIDLIADEIPLYPLFHRKTPTAYDKASLVDFKPIPLTGLSFVGVASTK